MVFWVAFYLWWFVSVLLICTMAFFTRLKVSCVVWISTSKLVLRAIKPYLDHCNCWVVMSDFLWPIECSPLGSSVHGILQARILEWVSLFFSRGSSWPRDWTHISCIGRRILYHWAIRKVHWEGMLANKQYVIKTDTSVSEVRLLSQFKDYRAVVFMQQMWRIINRR